MEMSEGRAMRLILTGSRSLTLNRFASGTFTLPRRTRFSQSDPTFRNMNGWRVLHNFYLKDIYRHILILSRHDREFYVVYRCCRLGNIPDIVTRLNFAPVIRNDCFVG